MAALAWAWGAAWLAIAALAAWPWVNRWLVVGPAAGEWRLIRWPLTVGLGWGLLTLWLLAVGFWQFSAWTALLFPALLLFLAVRPAWQARGRARSWLAGAPAALRRLLGSALRGDPAAWVVLGGLALFVMVLGQSTYYPFLGDDEISRYAYYARLMLVQGRLTADVRGYPMYMPMAYLYVFLVTGQVAEQLARVIPAVLSAMTVLATAGLGARWFGRTGGIAAALALMVSPLYLHWSPDGYVDIPSAFYFVLCACAADIWLSSRRLRWAALAGLLAGLALWTKQAGFVALACLGLAIGWGLLQDLIAGRRPAALAAVRAGLAALGAALLAGGLWYLRNAYFDGWANAVPSPGGFYLQQANTAWEYAIPFAGFFTVFGEIASTLYLAGLVWSVLRFKRAVWPLIWAAPYSLLWWRLFSYDARFLLTVLPFFAILFGGLAAEWRWPAPGWLRWAASLIVVAAVGWGAASSSLGGLKRWVTDPAASYADRLTHAKGGLYPAVAYLQAHAPAPARLLSMDGRIKYYLIDRAIDVGYPTTLAEVRRYDFFIVGSWWSSTYAGLQGSADNEVTRAFSDDRILQPVFYSPDYALVIYRVVKP
jgi:hypothetical protein